MRTSCFYRPAGAHDFREDGSGGCTPGYHLSPRWGWQSIAYGDLDLMVRRDKDPIVGCGSDSTLSGEWDSIVFSDWDFQREEAGRRLLFKEEFQEFLGFENFYTLPVPAGRQMVATGEPPGFRPFKLCSPRGAIEAFEAASLSPFMDASRQNNFTRNNQQCLKLNS